MKGKRIFDALTRVRDEYIDEASRTKLKKQHSGFRKLLTVAAGLVVVLGIGTILALQGLLPFGGSSGGAGHMGGSTFMSYAGPVFPMSLSKEDSDIAANRNIVYDFSLPREDSVRVWGSDVKDSYLLHNSSKEEKRITAIYPFAGSFQDLEKLIPDVTIEEQGISAELIAGGYSDRIAKLNSRENYQSLLEDGSYQRYALSPSPVLSEQVTVYTFADYVTPKEYPAATQAISFTIDPDKTTILTYGFEGGQFEEGGYRRFSYSVPNNERIRKGLKLLIVIGEDIGDYSLEGYKTGACEEGNGLDGVSVTITRSEQNLSDVMTELIGNYFTLKEHEIPGSREMFTRAVAEFMIQYDLLSTGGRYQMGMMEDVFSETSGMQRVFYLSFPITIAADGNILVSMNFHKDPSYDYTCSGNKNKDIQGYDMATRLGSNLKFNKLTAELLSYSHIEIVRQNYGFDLTKGISKINLDTSVDFYYLEIKPQKVK
ncbi:MAG TPA: hypothetical protein DDZ89_17885 [Clostridiales bacterium]|nr:hypothetical protein [Clostridiales bacterium]